MTMQSRPKFHLCSTAITNVAATNATNKIPCIIPIACVASGIFNRYLTGMAMKTRSNSEQPSRKAMIRKRPMPDFSNSFI